MLIVFDLDGTLFMTHKPILIAVEQLLTELSLPPLTDETIAAHIGQTSDQFLKSLLPDYVNLKEAQTRYRELERAAVKQNTELYPGIKELLSELLNKGHSLSVLSSGSIDYIELITKLTGIRHFFSEIYTAKYSLSKGQKLKEIIKYNQKLVMVGDTGYDIEAAIENKVPSIAVTYGYGKRTDLEKAAFMASKAEDILQIVGKIKTFDRLYSEISSKKAKIIGINGVDTSGKTTFTNNFASYLSSIGVKSQVLHIDDYHNPRAVRLTGENEIEAYYNNAFNYAHVITEVLQPLKTEGSINKSVLCLDLDRDTYSKTVDYTIDEDTLLIIEGVLLYRPPMNEYFDYRVFLDISFDTVLERARVRDVPLYGEAFLDKYRNKYIPIQQRYLSEHKPKEQSDMVIENES